MSTPQLSLLFLSICGLFCLIAAALTHAAPLVVIGTLATIPGLAQLARVTDTNPQNN